MAWAEDHPLLPALAIDRERLAALSPPLRDAIVRHFELQPARTAGRALGRLLDAPWFGVRGFELEDRIRAVKIVACLAALSEGARRSDDVLCRRRILEGTLASLLPPHGRLALAFEDLPLERSGGAGSLVAGMRRMPDQVVLNRRAIAADDRRLGEGPLGTVERRVGTTTVVHEVCHLCNPTAVGPTYAAFMDEYRAWMVDFVAFAGRRPRMVEGRGRCREVLTRPRYDGIGRVLRTPGVERDRVIAFVRRLATDDEMAAGAGMTIESLLADDGDDFDHDAPLPDPPGQLDNDATRSGADAGPSAASSLP